MPTAPRLRADVFPANVTLAPANSPGGSATSIHTQDSPLPPDHRSLQKVRIVVTLEQVLIFQDSASGPALVFSEPLLDYTAPAPQARRTLRNMYQTREATLTTESGKTLAFHRSAQCGCGSRLKGFRPFGEGTTYAVASTTDALTQPAVS